MTQRIEISTRSHGCLVPARTKAAGQPSPVHACLPCAFAPRWHTTYVAHLTRSLARGLERCWACARVRTHHGTCACAPGGSVPLPPPTRAGLILSGLGGGLQIRWGLAAQTFDSSWPAPNTPFCSEHGWPSQRALVGPPSEAYIRLPPTRQQGRGEDGCRLRRRSMQRDTLRAWRPRQLRKCMHSCQHRLLAASLLLRREGGQHEGPQHRCGD